MPLIGLQVEGRAHGGVIAETLAEMAHVQQQPHVSSPLRLRTHLEATKSQLVVYNHRQECADVPGGRAGADAAGRLVFA